MDFLHYVAFKEAKYSPLKASITRYVTEHPFFLLCRSTLNTWLFLMTISVFSYESFHTFPEAIRSFQNLWNSQNLT